MVHIVLIEPRSAVGCLIPDDLYDPMMEGKSIEVILKGSPALAAYLGAGEDRDVWTRTVTVDLLLNLQTIHDLEPASRWRRELDQLAENRGL